MSNSESLIVLKSLFLLLTQQGRTFFGENFSSDCIEMLSKMFADGKYRHCAEFMEPFVKCLEPKVRVSELKKEEHKSLGKLFGHAATVVKEACSRLKIEWNGDPTSWAELQTRIQGLSSFRTCNSRYIVESCEVSGASLQLCVKDTKSDGTFNVSFVNKLVQDFDKTSVGWKLYINDALCSVSELDVLAEVQNHVAAKVNQAFKICLDFKGRCIFPTKSIKVPVTKSARRDAKTFPVVAWLYQWITVIVRTLSLNISLSDDLEAKLLGDLDFLSDSSLPEYLLEILKLGRQRLIDTITEANGSFALQRTSKLYFDKILALFYLADFNLIKVSSVFSNCKSNGIAVCSPEKTVCFKIQAEEMMVVIRWLNQVSQQLKRCGSLSQMSFTICLDQLPSAKCKDALLVPNFRFSALFKPVLRRERRRLADIKDIACELIPVCSWDDLSRACDDLNDALTNGQITAKQYIELYTGSVLVILRTLFPIRYSSIYNFESNNLIGTSNVIGQVVLIEMENHKCGQAKRTKRSIKSDKSVEFPFVLPRRGVKFLTCYEARTNLVLHENGQSRDGFLLVTGDGRKADYAYCEKVYAKFLNRCFGIPEYKLGSANAWRKYNDHLVAVEKTMQSSAAVLDNLFLEHSEDIAFKHYAGDSHKRAGAVLRFKILMRAINKECRQAGKANGIFESLASIDETKLVRDVLGDRNCKIAALE